MLPAAAKREGGGSAQGVAQAIAQRLGRPGTYAVVAGTSFSAGSTTCAATGAAGDRGASGAHRGEGMPAVLLDFVDRVGELRSGGSGSGSGGSDGGGPGAGTLLLLPLLALGGGADAAVAPCASRREQEAELAELRENVRDDLVALGDDIRALDLDVEMPGVDPRAKADYDHAVEAYDRADTLRRRGRARPRTSSPSARRSRRAATR